MWRKSRKHGIPTGGSSRKGRKDTLRLHYSKYDPWTSTSASESFLKMQTLAPL